MQFSDREDIDAPVAFVYGELTDFAAFERSGMRRGADVRRTDGYGPYNVGASWDVNFELRGRRRDIKLRLTDLRPDEGHTVETKMSGIETVMNIDLVALNPRKTRMIVKIDMRPTNMPSRLLIQSMKLAKNSLERRFKKRVRDFALDLGARHAGI